MAKDCPNCGAMNRDDARFCAGCAYPLVQEVACPNCGARNQPKARYCNQCAAPLAVAAPAGVPGAGLLSNSNLLGNRYRIIAKIGQGGMGAVYKAEDIRLGQRVVAVKELSEAALTTPLERQQARQAFEQEAQMLARLNHLNLPAVSDHFAENGQQYLVMEYVEGETLDETLRQAGGPLPEQQVLDWAEQLCNVLDYLHAQQPPIIFRDLKPANIMIERSGRIKLIDFGIARLFKAGKSTDTASFGTAGYAPPEQYGKGQTDARSDIYALGVTLHQLLTGADPAQMPFQFRPARDLNPNISPAVEAAIMRAVERDPAQRWQSAGEMKRAFYAPPPAAASQPAPARRAAADAAPGSGSPAAKPRASGAAKPAGTPYLAKPAPARAGQGAAAAYTAPAANVTPAAAVPRPAVRRLNFLPSLLVVAFVVASTQVINHGLTRTLLDSPSLQQAILTGLLASVVSSLALPLICRTTRLPGVALLAGAAILLFRALFGLPLGLSTDWSPVVLPAVLEYLTYAHVIAAAVAVELTFLVGAYRNYGFWRTFWSAYMGIGAGGLITSALFPSAASSSNALGSFFVALAGALGGGILANLLARAVRR